MTGDEGEWPGPGTLRGIRSSYLWTMMSCYCLKEAREGNKAVRNKRAMSC